MNDGKNDIDVGRILPMPWVSNRAHSLEPFSDAGRVAAALLEANAYSEQSVNGAKLGIAPPPTEGRKDLNPVARLWVA